MERRTCENTGLTLPVLGIGCWAFGGNESDYWGVQEEAEIERVVNAALDAGANYFDTAEGYNDGRSEEALGRALKKRRAEAVIGTKVSPSNARPDLLRRSCEASLKRLQTDYLDLYMPHWPLTEYPIEPAVETLAALRAEGKIRHVGLSNFGKQQLREAAGTGVPLATDQVCYNLLSRAIEFEILPECRRQGIGVVAYMPFQQGLLTGKFSTLDEIPPVRLRTRHFLGSRPLSRHGEAGAEAEVLAVLEGLRSISKESGLPLAHLALAWLIQRPGVACALAGIRSLAQLQEGLAGAAVRLSPDLLQRLDQYSEPLKQKLGQNADYFQGVEGSRIR
jgi:aryl-alcohol dehydrogenase-like predicted oxidoreductase